MPVAAVTRGASDKMAPTIHVISVLRFGTNLPGDKQWLP